MESGEWRAKEEGCRGMSPLMDLPYVLHSTLWPQPIGDLFGHGLVKSLFKCVLAPKKNGQEKDPWTLTDTAKATMRA